MRTTKMQKKEEEKKVWVGSSLRGGGRIEVIVKCKKKVGG